MVLMTNTRNRLGRKKFRIKPYKFSMGEEEDDWFFLLELWGNESWNIAWKYHIDAITAKISKTVGLISKLRHSIPRHILLYIYQTLIHPHLNYGLAAWGQASKTSLNKILILQKKVLRMMYFTDIREHAIPLFIDAGILPVSFMYYKTVANLMYDINNNNSLTNLLNLFEKTSTIHSYYTRSSSSGNFHVKAQSWKYTKTPCLALV